MAYTEDPTVPVEKSRTEIEADEILRMQERETQLQQVGWPWPLVKALSDCYDYRIGLRDGSVVHFTSASCTDDPQPQWVTIEADGLEVTGPLKSQLDESEGYPARGLVVRVSEIVWAIDGYK